jgi:ketosteroid isomerase-like protein
MFGLLLPLLAVVPVAAPPRTADVAPMIEAERAFARLGAAEGIGPAFRRYAAADALLFAPGPTPATARLSGNPPGMLRWWPTYVGIAASGELGFTTGPYVFEGAKRSYGHFFTIWRRQPDGSWRWILDHGVGTAEASTAGPDSPVALCPQGKPEGAAAEAWAEVAAAEARLARGLAVDAPKAYAAALADDGRVMREGPQPAVGRAAFVAALDAGPRAVTAATLGGAASKAGDLAYTYGDIAWDEGGKTVRGHYIRIWQHRARGWALLVDETTRAPPG